MEINPTVIKVTANNCKGDMVLPNTIKAKTPATAPDVFPTGEFMETSRYLKPIYPKAMERMYMDDTGR